MGNGNHSPNLTGLSDFVGSTDREPALFFVGRQDVLGQIKRDLERRLRHWRAGREGAWQGGTWLIQGAPGAGKTALLSHLKQTLPAAMKTDNGNERVELQVCSLHTRDLCSAVPATPHVSNSSGKP